MEPLSEVLNRKHVDVRAAGWKLLQPYRFADDDAAHVATLLGLAGFAHGSVVLDVGCGVGECARLMTEQRQDLRFVLVNSSEEQLSDCPEEFERHLADAHRLPFKDEAFDAVMFNAALGNMDARAALSEASRVLKPNGVLFLNEVRRVSGDNDAMRNALGFEAQDSARLAEFCSVFGIDVQDLWTGDLPVREYLRSVWPDGAGSYEAIFSGAQPGVWRGVKSPLKDHLSKFKRPALHFSGGKDSLACLYLLREHLDRVAVYWLDTGDGCPETLEVIEAVKAWVPNFITVKSDVIAWRNKNGHPSDLVPAKAHPIGLMYGMNKFALVNRFDCCSANLMQPLHERMIADGVDLVIRGTKTCDTGRVPHDGAGEPYSVYLPIKDWSHARVFEYLDSVGAPVNRIYKHFKGISAPECMGCTAWWDDGKARYLADLHPELLAGYQANLSVIAGAISSHMADLYSELSEV